MRPPFVQLVLLMLLLTKLDYPHVQILKLVIYQKPLDAKVKIKIEYTVPLASKNPHRHQVLAETLTPGRLKP